MGVFMASDDGNLIGSITRRNLVAATTLVVAALASRAARARGQGDQGNQGDGGGGGHGAHCYLRGTAIRTP